jgi:hypothetical protein
MDNLLFSQNALYQLQQLVKPVRDKTGVRHRLSDQKDLFSLLRYSCTSPDSVISEYYSMFIDELNDEQKAYLQGRGLLLTRTIKPKDLSSRHQQRKLATGRI